MKKIHILHIPLFKDPMLDEYIRVVGRKNLPELKSIMDGKRHTLDSICSYAIRLDCHDMFDNDNTAYDVEILMNIPKTTAGNYKKIYDRDLPFMLKK